MALRDAHFEITATDRTAAAWASAQQRMTGFEASIGRVGNLLKGALSVGAVIGLAKSIGEAAAEAERTEKRLQGVMRATGGAVGLTLSQVNQLVEELAAGTRFQDEAVREAAGSLMAFGNIQGEIFREGLRLSTDLATLLGTDVEDAVEQVGKALSDPEKGFDRLARKIGDLDFAQKKAIESALEHNDLAKAQAVILEGLREKVGGLAQELNTGLGAEAANVAKQWDEMLEALGRSSPVANAASGAMNLLAGGLKAVREELEAAQRQTQARMEFAANPQLPRLPGPGLGGDIRVRTGMTLEDAAALQKGVQARKRAEDDLRLENEEKAAKKIGDAAKRLNAERERLRQEDIRGWVAHADEVFRLADEMNMALAKIAQDDFAERERLRQEDIAGWVQHAEEVFRAADQENLAIAEVNEALEKQSDIARELGLTFSSAFEDAILAGKKFSDVLKGLADDIARIILRKTITERLAGAVSEGIGKIIGEIFPQRAAGGPVSAGRAYLVGERGPELFLPDTSGVIAAGVGGNTLNVTFNINALDPRSVTQVIAQQEPIILGMMNRAYNRIGRRGPMG